MYKHQHGQGFKFAVPFFDALVWPDAILLAQSKRPNLKVLNCHFFTHPTKPTVVSPGSLAPPCCQEILRYQGKQPHRLFLTLHYVGSLTQSLRHVVMLFSQV